MDVIAVLLIVALAGFYLVRRFCKGLKNRPSCGCGSCGKYCSEQKLPCQIEKL